MQRGEEVGRGRWWWVITSAELLMKSNCSSNISIQRKKCFCGTVFLCSFSHLYDCLSVGLCF